MTDHLFGHQEIGDRSQEIGVRRLFYLFSPHPTSPLPHTPYPTPHTPHPIPHTPYPTPHTPHPTPHTPHPTPYGYLYSR
ncbi:MAG: hypothetical protein EWV55_10045 [Microcystis viridis Mv_BB_P_19951000_S69]|uniref:Uncharacterized protein n=1 Tax=Microcystis viridis Mv_BB_P_19951000_S68D TaxID=2486270 RepID=A0A552HEP5_MICVR|nr:MAG: hypothetical protein EWV77_18350 [Microcystis viridis Mv_BB_P_19951000_S68D]TRU74957.1 MAG: hypothetical protein EWV55_10045 [Microcystis viridis Mv_BB_P_19951000_S69]TRU78894.1 MAG: hypothetical protein EWV47_01055 [Microcystis viridis Mv_BB_P_19951000_S68]TRU88652.1 MAG: hypothetical protein EWV46_05590 [Microcystis viridis Mv_BB_P_19951000_S69D]